MANPGQEMSQVLTTEQYEANKHKIARMKEYLQAFELSNEAGHDTYKDMQQELQRRITEGERAHQMLQELTQQASAPQNIVPPLPAPARQQVPTTASIQEVTSSSSRPSSVAQEPTSTKRPYTHSSVRGRTGPFVPQAYTPPAFPNDGKQQQLHWISSQNQNPSVYRPPPSNSTNAYNFSNSYPPGQSNGTASAFSHYVPQDNTFVENGSSLKTPAVPSNQPERGKEHQDAMRAAYEQILRLLRTFPLNLEGLRWSIREAYNCHAVGHAGAGRLQSITDLLKFFSLDEARQILHYVGLQLPRIAGEPGHFDPNLSTNEAPNRVLQPPPVVNGVQQPNTRPMDQQPPQPIIAEHQVLRHYNREVQSAETQLHRPIPPLAEPSSNAPVTHVLVAASEVTQPAVGPQSSQTSSKPSNTTMLKEKLQLILQQLHTQNKTNGEVVEIIKTAYEAITKLKKPENSLAAWVLGMLQEFPRNVIADALKNVLTKLVIQITSRIPQSATASSTHGASTSTSSLAGALDPSSEPPESIADQDVLSASIEEVSTPLNGAQESMDRLVENVEGRAAVYVPPFDPQYYKPTVQVMLGPSRETQRMKSHERSSPSIVPADLTRLGHQILVELGKPTGAMPALSTTSEAKAERKRTKKLRKAAWEEASREALREDERNAASGLAQAINQSQAVFLQKALISPTRQAFNINVAGEPRTIQPSPARIIELPSSEEPQDLPILLQASSGVEAPLHQAEATVIRISSDVEGEVPLPEISPVMTVLPTRLMNGLSLHAETPGGGSPAIELTASMEKCDIQSSPPGGSAAVELPVNVTGPSSSPRRSLVARPVLEPGLPTPLERRSKSITPLFLVSDSEPPEDGQAYISPLEEPRVKELIEQTHSIGPSVDGDADGNPPSLTGFPELNSEANPILISDSENEAPRAPLVKTSLKRKRVWVEVPPLPAWARTKSKPGSTSEEGSIDDAEQVALEESYSRLRTYPCYWRNCSVLLNCANNLSKHLVAHVRDREMTSSSFKCRWTNCTRRFNSLSQLEGHVSSHARRPIFCAYEGCEDSFHIPRHLLNHNLIEHQHDLLRPSASPFTFIPKTLVTPLPKSVPTFMTVSLPITQASISAERHSKLGPWVLRRIYGPINTKGLKYNAGTTLRGSRRLDRSKETDDQSEGPESLLEEIRFLRPDKYDFVDDSHKGSRRRFDDLPTAQVSEDVSDGLVLLWGKNGGSRARADEVSETDDELLLVPMDSIES